MSTFAAPVEAISSLFRRPESRRNRLNQTDLRQASRTLNQSKIEASVLLAAYDDRLLITAVPCDDYPIVNWKYGAQWAKLFGKVAADSGIVYCPNDLTILPVRAEIGTQSTNSAIVAAEQFNRYHPSITGNDRLDIIDELVLDTDVINSPVDTVRSIARVLQEFPDKAYLTIADQPIVDSFTSMGRFDTGTVVSRVGDVTGFALRHSTSQSHDWQPITQKLSHY